MHDIKVASRYAKSLLQLAVDKNALEYVQHDMSLFKKVCEENHDFVLMLKSPIIHIDKKQTVLKKIFDGKVNPLTLSLFTIITNKGREKFLPDIAIEFVLQYKKMKNILIAEVTTSFTMNDDVRNSVLALIRSSHNGEVELNEKVDTSIIGGFILKTGDTQIDHSIQSKLNKLKNKFQEKSYTVKQ